MLFERNGVQPRVDAKASVAESASIVGDVTIGSRCYIDHNVVIESSGPPVEIDAEVVVFAGSVIRSVGGQARPGFSTHVGTRTLVAPQCALSGCRIGRNCYVATDVTVLQGADVGDGVRLGVGAIVHAGTVLPELTRVGMRHVAVPTEDGYVSTADIERTRELVSAASFFDRAFATADEDQAHLHGDVIAKLLEEVHGWHDDRVA
jgi:carbonic anhydrase/acetyltransferase-like protein (isoleucine patch superfamily)